MDKEILRRARSKKRKGEKLSKAEESELSEYQRRYGQLSVRIYFESDEQKEALRKLADAEGAPSFSSWILRRVEHSLSGDAIDRRQVQRDREELTQLRERTRSLETQLEVERRRTTELTTQHFQSMSSLLQALNAMAEGRLKPENLSKAIEGIGGMPNQP